MTEQQQINDFMRSIARDMSAETAKGGGRLIPEAVKDELRRSLTLKSQFAVFDGLTDGYLERMRAEHAARPWHAKVRFWFVRHRNSWSWRLSKAWAHLRGIECECDC